MINCDETAEKFIIQVAQINIGEKLNTINKTTISGFCWEGEAVNS